MKTTTPNRYTHEDAPVLNSIPQGVTIQSEVFHMDRPACRSTSLQNCFSASEEPPVRLGYQQSAVPVEGLCLAEGHSLIPFFQSEELHILYQPTTGALCIYILDNTSDISLVELDQKHGIRFLAEEVQKPSGQVEMDLRGLARGVCFLKFRLQDGRLHSVLKIVIR